MHQSLCFTSSKAFCAAARAETVSGAALCDGEFLSNEGAAQVVHLTERTDNETVYTTYDRIDAIAGEPARPSVDTLSNTLAAPRPAAAAATRSRPLA